MYKSSSQALREPKKKQGMYSIKELSGECDIQKKNEGFTVEDFLEDVRLINAGKQPHRIGIGLKHTPFQKFQDEEIQARNKSNNNTDKMTLKAAYNKRQDIELARMTVAEIQQNKRKELRAYEKLEMQLQKFEEDEENDQVELEKLMLANSS